jgi:uridine kinase
MRRVLDEALLPLQRGELARYRQTPWWLAQTGEPERLLEVKPGGTVIVEGCYVHRPELRDHFDLSLWVERDVAEALADALARDGGERDRTVWEHVYIPNESRYIESERPQKRADMVVRNKGRAFRVERLGCASSG